MGEVARLAEQVNPLAVCTPERGHACEACRPGEFPEYAPRCADCARAR